jgi:hypothetical protein
MNPNITFDIVKENVERPWNWSYLSKNPNITWNDVKENIEMPWDWSQLCANPNMLLSIDDLVNIVKQDHSASIIQRVWKQAISVPSHPACKRRLLREYRECEFV